MRPLVSLVDVVGKAGMISDGDWVESKDQDPDGEVRLVQLADIGVGIFLDKSKRFMTADKARVLKCTYLRKADILIARMPDPLGRACQFPGDKRTCVTVVDVCVLRPDENIADASYVTHILNSDGVRRQLEKFIKGTTRQRISRTNLEQIFIPLPPLPEQRRIAAILDQADALRAKRRDSLAQLESLKQSIFLDMFGDPATNPKAWNKSTFDCFFSDVTSSCEKLENSNYQEKGEFPVIDQGQRRIAGFCDNRKILCPVELPVTVFGDHTRIIKHIDFPFVVGADGAKVLKASQGINPLFASELLRLLPIPNLGYSRHMKEVRRLVFIVPPKALQDVFEIQIRSVERTEQTTLQSLYNLDALFSSLQYRAFRGEL